MRLGWNIHVWGPVYVGGTLMRTHSSGYQRKYRTLDCGHAHRTLQAYYECPVVRKRDRER